MAKLVCQTGPKAGHEYPIDRDRIVFGRLTGCDGVIVDAKASREHFAIHRHNHLCSVVDLQSRNGTRVNGDKIHERLLDFGDRIKVGECEYLFVKEAGDKALDDLLTKYQLEDKIGEGGMGIVYRACQRSMDRVVALKILSPRHAQKRHSIDQFIEEARAAGSLNHPNIIQVHDVGTENGIHFFSMEFVDGPTCMQLLKQSGPLNPAAGMEILRQTAKALEYAHGQRIIHRDIKPDNIMLTSEEVVKLADLGISKSAEDLAKQGDRAIVGTPHYIAPEVAKGDPADYRLDIYSLGATAYHLLAGRTPYSGTNPTEILKAHVIDEPQPLHEFVPGMPRQISDLVKRLMAKDPDQRPQSATEVVGLIEILQNNLGLERQQTNGETLLLRRLADGETRSSGTLSSIDDPSVVTSESLSEVRSASRNPLPIILIALFALLATAVAWKVLADGDASDNGLRLNLPERETPGEPDTESPPNDVTEPEGEDDPTIARESALIERIDSLRQQTLEADNLAALAAVNRTLNAIQGEDHTPRSRQRLEALRSTIRDRNAHLRRLESERGFSVVRDEVFTLLDQREFDRALQRITAFLNQHGDHAPDNARHLQRDVQTRRREYQEGIERSLTILLQRKDEAGLRALRDNLPDSMAGSEIANQINAGLRVLAEERLAEQERILVEARSALANWNLNRVEDLHRSHRETFGDTPNGRTLEELGAVAKELTSMVAVLDRALKPYKPFQGQLHYLQNPDLVGADRMGILARMDAGEVTVRWSDIDAMAMDQIFTLANPQRADDFRRLYARRNALIEAGP